MSESLYKKLNRIINQKVRTAKENLGYAITAYDALNDLKKEWCEGFNTDREADITVSEQGERIQFNVFLGKNDSLKKDAMLFVERIEEVLTKKGWKISEYDRDKVKTDWYFRRADKRWIELTSVSVWFNVENSTKCRAVVTEKQRSYTDTRTEWICED